MFGATNNSGFGGFGQQQNNAQPGAQQTGGLFGQQQGQQPANPGGGFGGFGAQQQPQQPAFGASASTSGGLFGAAAQQPAQQQGAGGFQFGQTNNAAAPAFGQPQNKPAGFGGFGSSTNTANAGGFGGFGASSNTQQNAFGAANTGANAFGAKPAGSLFGQAQPQQQGQQGGLFGQPAATGGMFGGGAAGLSAQQTGGMPTQGTSNPPYQPFVNTEKDATGSGSTNYQYNTITCLPAYRAASIEELRVQDYQQGRKSGTAGPGGTLGGTFGQPAATAGFGQPANSGGLFGQTQQTGGGGFGGGGGGLFGQQQNNQQQQNTSGGLFGQSNTNTGGGLFGQQQNTQAGQSGGLFGQNNQQPSSTGFGFGGGQQQPQQQQQAGSGFTFGQNNQQNKPAGLFGGSSAGFGATAAAPAQSAGGFTFGGTSQPPQTNPAGNFGANSNTASFGFGAANNQAKPGGLFGQPAASTGTGFGGFGASASAADASKPAFSFGGTGFGASAAPGQQTTAAPTGGLFGSTQPAGAAPASSGFTFGASNTQQQQGTGLFGGAQQTAQPSTTFGGGGGLFGQSKPAVGGGLFGSTQQNAGQQPGASGFNFGAASAAPSSTGMTTGGGLFGGASANKPATGGLFGTGGFGGSSQAGQTGGLFGSSTAAPQQPGGGLFGAQNNGATTGTGAGGLFGSSTAPGMSSGTAGGGLFGGGGSTFGASGFGGQQTSSLFGSQAQLQARPNLQASLNVNPYGTDALFGGSASIQGGVNSLGGIGSVGSAGGSQTLLPFNVARPAAKKQPPLVPPFRPSPRNTARVAKLRGSTPGLAYGSTPVPGRESTPSLFTSSTAGTRLSSPSVASNSSLFRGLSDDLPRSQREGSLPAQAFVSRPSVKRLVLDDQTNKSLLSTHGRSQSLFGSTRDSASATPGPQSRAAGSLFDRSTPAANPQRVNFSPALETAASSRTPNGRISAPEDSTFSVRDTSLFGGEPSPSKGAMEFVGRDHSLPSFQPLKSAKSNAVNTNEDALLPLDYYTKPPLSELREWSYAELSAVEGFIVGRKGYGKVEFVEPVDLNTVGELSNVPGGIVQLRKKECYVYPDEEDCFDPETCHERDGVQPGFDPKRIPGGKAKMGTGLNVPAVVHLEGCWPIDRSTRQPIKDADHVRVKQLISKLKRRQDMNFRSYEAVTGTWSFRVEHFSRYGLDSDEEEDEEVMEGVTKDASQQEKAKPAQEVTPRQVPNDARTTRQSRSQTPSAVPTPSEAAASQPWAATLGLEARRLQVMQASFFGGDEKTNVYEPTPAASRKKGRESDAKVQTSGKDVGARTHFGAPMKKPSMVPSKTISSGRVLAEKDEIMDELASNASVSIRPHKITKLIPDTSIVDGAHDLILDAGLALGRSFRAGWGQEGVLFHRSPLRVPSQEDRSEQETAMGRIGLVRQSRLDVFQGDNAKRQEEVCLALLEIQLRNAIVEADEGDEDGDACPVAYPDPHLRFKQFASALDDSLDDSRGSNARRYELAIFRLASALFDEIDLQLDSKASSATVRANAMRLRRKNAVSDWLRWYVDEGLRSEIRAHHASTLPSSTSGERIIFSLLSAGQFEEACRQALEIGDVRLATLLAQVDGGGGDEEFRLDLLDQLSVWRAGGVDAFISPEYRRIFELLSGNVHISKGNGKRDEAERVDDLAICHGLDWKRTFSCFLHFNLPFEAGLEEVVTAFERSVGRGEGDHVIVPPLPPYLERDVRPGSKRFRDVIKSKAYPVDVLFSLLKLFSRGDYPLESVLDAKQYCPSPLNVSLAFHLGQLLSRVLGVRDFSDRVDLGIEGETIARLINQRGNSATHDNLCVQYALQLETVGQWTWSAFVLLHLEMRESRRENIRALLARNVGRLISDDDRSEKEERFLTQTLKIPARWIDEARADHAGYTNDRYGEYRHLLRARLYGRAHDVAICFLAPEAIVRHDFGLILDLFAPFRKRDIRAAAALQPAVGTAAPAGNLSTASSDVVDANDGDENMERADDGSGDEIDVPGWQRGGQVYVDYIATCRSLPWLVANNAEKVIAALEREPLQDSTAAQIDALCAHLASIAGQATADAVRRIDSMARKLPELVKRIDELFDAFVNTRGHRTTLTVARSQMVASLDNCVRSLRSSRSLGRLVAVLPSLDVDTYADRAPNDDDSNRRPPIEVDSIQFMANAYCTSLIEGSA